MNDCFPYKKSGIAGVPKKRRQVTPDYISHNWDSPKQREFPYIECDNFIPSNNGIFKRFLKKIKTKIN